MKQIFTKAAQGIFALDAQAGKKIGGLVPRFFQLWLFVVAVGGFCWVFFGGGLLFFFKNVHLRRNLRYLRTKVYQMTDI